MLPPASTQSNDLEQHQSVLVICPTLVHNCCFTTFPSYHLLYVAIFENRTDVEPVCPGVQSCTVYGWLRGGSPRHKSCILKSIFNQHVRWAFTTIWHKLFYLHGSSNYFCLSFASPKIHWRLLSVMYANKISAAITCSKIHWNWNGDQRIIYTYIFHKFFMQVLYSYIV